MHWRPLSLITLGLWVAPTWADSAKNVDAEIVRNLDFYQYLDVVETENMYELLEKADSADEGPHNRRNARDSKRGEDSQ